MSERKDWREKGYKGILVGIDDSAHKIWVPELGAEVVSTNVVINELATGELEQGEFYKTLSEKEIADENQKTYTVDDFAHLKGTVHTDNEDGLQYKVTAIREHITRQGFQIVVDRVCLVGGHTDTVYARDAAAMTGAFVVDRELVSGNGGDTVHALDVAAMTERVPQSAAAGPTLPAASEHTGRVNNALPTHLQQTLLKPAETGDLHLVQELLRQGADPN